MKYILAILILILFNGSAQMPSNETVEIDSLDLAIDKAVMEGNRLEADDAKRDQQIAGLLSERFSN